MVLPGKLHVAVLLVVIYIAVHKYGISTKGP